MKDPNRPDADGNRLVSDEQLLRRYMQGDTQAFEQLIDRYRLELFHFLARYLGDPALAEDVFQETFLQVHLSAGGFDLNRRLKPWLFTIAANKARDALRTRTRRSAVSLDAEIDAGGSEPARFVDLMPAEIPSPESSLENRETALGVQEIVRQMPESLRAVLLLSYFHELPYKEIAEILELPLGTVKSRLHVAVREFARRWQAGTGRRKPS